MSITKILKDKELESSEKLQQIILIIDEIRKSYGNQDIKISTVEVNTVQGLMNFLHLSDDDKIAILINEIQAVKVRAIEFSNNNQGVNINKKIEELIATNAMFVNINSSTEFAYL